MLTMLLIISCLYKRMIHSLKISLYLCLLQSRLVCVCVKIIKFFLFSTFNCAKNNNKMSSATGIFEFQRDINVCNVYKKKGSACDECLSFESIPNRDLCVRMHSYYIK